MPYRPPYPSSASSSVSGASTPGIWNPGECPATTAARYRVQFRAEPYCQRIRRSAATASGSPPILAMPSPPASRTGGATYSSAAASAVATMIRASRAPSTAAVPAAPNPNIPMPRRRRHPP